MGFLLLPQSSPLSGQTLAGSPLLRILSHSRERPILVKVLFCLLDLLSFYLARMHTGVKDEYLGVPGFEGNEVWLEVLKLLRLTP